MKRYSLVRDVNGEEHTLELEPTEAEDSRQFWKLLGWSLFEL